MMWLAILKTCFHNRPNAKAPNLSDFRTRRFVLRFNSLLSSALFRSSLYNSSLNAFAGPRIRTSSMIHVSYPQCPCLRLFGCKSQVDALQCPLFHMAASVQLGKPRSSAPGSVIHASVQVDLADSVLRWTDSSVQSRREGQSCKSAFDLR